MSLANAPALTSDNLSLICNRVGLAARLLSMTPEHPVTNAVDRFLTHYKHSPKATMEARAVLNYFQHMVDLATDRAVEWLAVPDNVVVVDFRRDTKPDEPHPDIPA